MTLSGGHSKVYFISSFKLEPPPPHTPNVVINFKLIFPDFTWKNYITIFFKRLLINICCMQSCFLDFRIILFGKTFFVSRPWVPNLPKLVKDLILELSTRVFFFWSFARMNSIEARSKAENTDLYKSSAFPELETLINQSWERLYCWYWDQCLIAIFLYSED